MCTCAGSKDGLVTMAIPAYNRKDVGLTKDTVTAMVEIKATSSAAMREGLDLVAVLDVSGHKIESVKKARVEAQGACQQIQEVRQVAAGKAFLLQSKFTSKRYILLTRVWSSPGAFVDLPRSVDDAAQFFQAEEGSSTEKLFWTQYLAPEHPTPLSDQLKQLTELHRGASLAVKDLIV